MPAPIVYINARDIVIPQEDLEEVGERSGIAQAKIRQAYRKAGEDDGTLGGSLWERIAERATLGA